MQFLKLKDVSIGTLCLFWGILAIVGTAIGLIPSLRELNWFNIPFGTVGVLISIIALATTKKPRQTLFVGFSLCLFAVVIAILGLIIAGAVI